MNRFSAILLTLCLLLAILTGCSATGRIRDPFYGNVSTTPDGRINGTNDAYRQYDFHRTDRSGQSGASSTSPSSTERGTGMAGGR